MVPFPLVGAPYDAKQVKLQKFPLDPRSKTFAVLRVPTGAFPSTEDVFGDGQGSGEDFGVVPDAEPVDLIAKTWFADAEHPNGFDPDSDDGLYRLATQLANRERSALHRIHGAACQGQDIGWLVRPAETPMVHRPFVLLERYGPSLTALQSHMALGTDGLNKSSKEAHRLLALALVCGVRSFEALEDQDIAHRDPHEDNLRFDLSVEQAGTLVGAKYVCLVDLDHARSPEFGTHQQGDGVAALLGHPGYQSPRIWSAYASAGSGAAAVPVFDKSTDLFGFAVALCQVVLRVGPWVVVDGRRQRRNLDSQKLQDSTINGAIKQLLAEHNGREGHVCAYDRDASCAFGTALSRGLVEFDPASVLKMLNPLDASEFGSTVKKFIELTFTIADPTQATDSEVVSSAMSQLSDIVDALEKRLGLDPADRPPMGGYKSPGRRSGTTDVTGTVDEFMSNHVDREFVNPLEGRRHGLVAQRERMDSVYEEQHPEFSARNQLALDRASDLAGEATLSDQIPTSSEHALEEDPQDADYSHSSAVTVAQVAPTPKAPHGTSYTTWQSLGASCLVAVAGIGAIALDYVPASLGELTWSALCLGAATGLVGMFFGIILLLPDPADRPVKIALGIVILFLVSLSVLRFQSNLTDWTHFSVMALALAALALVLLTNGTASRMTAILRGAWAGLPLVALPILWMLEWVVRNYVPAASWRFVDWNPIQQIGLIVSLMVLWIIAFPVKRRKV